MRIAALLLAVALGGGLRARAQGDYEDGEYYPPAEETRGSVRDPFAPPGGVAPRKPSSGRDSLGFRPGQYPDGIPKMSLKGHVQSKDGKVVALLEIQGGGVHIVREGDTVGLHDLGSDSVIRIREINRLHLVIESGSLGRVIVVR